MTKPTIFEKANTLIGKFALKKLQKDYNRKYNTELPVVTVLGSVEKSIEKLFVTKLFEVNEWDIIAADNKNNFRSAFNSIKQKNTILLVEGDRVNAIPEVATSRGPNFALLINDKYTLNNYYLWPKSVAKVIPELEQLQTKYNLNKVSLQHILENIKLPSHTFDRLMGRLDTTIIDSTFDTDPLSLHNFLDTFEEVATIYSHADFDSPEYNNSIVVPPKHTIILGEMGYLGDDSILEHKKVLDRLKGYRKDYEYYLDEIYLVGDEWLKCDEQGFAKNDGLVSYIRYANITYKVVKNAPDLDTFWTDDLIRPHSWYWLKGSQELVWLSFRLTK
jgi:hypothetical protein